MFQENAGSLALLGPWLLETPVVFPGGSLTPAVRVCILLLQTVLKKCPDLIQTQVLLLRLFLRSINSISVFVKPHWRIIAASLHFYRSWVPQLFPTIPLAEPPPGSNSIFLLSDSVL